MELQADIFQVRFRKRRRVQNYIGTIHAIAMCNLAELAASMLTDASVPPTIRWIAKGMIVEFLKRGVANVTATAEINAIHSPDESSEPPATGRIVDTPNTAEILVIRAMITMYFSPKTRKKHRAENA